MLRTDPRELSATAGLSSSAGRSVGQANRAARRSEGSRTGRILRGAASATRQCVRLGAFGLSLLAAALWGGMSNRVALGAEPDGLQTVQAMEQTLVKVIAQAEPSVVAVARVRKEQPGESLPLELRPDPLGRRLSAPSIAGPTDPDFIPNEYAAGVVIDRGGLVLTAHHVLAPDSEYYVTTHQRRVYRATVKGADPRSDLAVLAIEADDLQPIRWGDAAAVRKGQIVIALGNPYAIGRDGQASASWGIVANLGRKSPPLGDEPESAGKRTLHQFGTLIQTDARLNQGASGGALLNLRGEMVGLIVALASTPGFEQAAGYAIPIDSMFRRVIDTLKQGREVEYGFLGIRPANLRQQELAQGRRGVRVQNVVPGTPAERHGLRPDDLILAVGGVSVDRSDDLMLELGRMPVEAVARLHLLRGRDALDLDVTLAKFPVQGMKVVTVQPRDWRGLRIDYVTAGTESPAWPAGARSVSMSDAVVVTEVQEGTPAWHAGLRPGMLISHVGRVPTRTPREFQAAVTGKRTAVQVRLLSLGDQPSASTRTIGPES